MFLNFCTRNRVKKVQSEVSNKIQPCCWLCVHCSISNNMILFVSFFGPWHPCALGSSLDLTPVSLRLPTPASRRSALQILHKVCEVSRRHNYFPGGMALTWLGYYESCISSEQSCINQWNAMRDLETTRPDSPDMFVDKSVVRSSPCLYEYSSS